MFESLLKPRRQLTRGHRWTNGSPFGFWRVLAALALGLLPSAAKANSFTMYVLNAYGTVSAVTPAGAVSTFANGIYANQCLTIDGNGNLYVANSTSDTISQITPAGVVSTFASWTPVNGPIGLTAQPTALAFGPNGDLYVAESSGYILQITPAGVQSTFASGFNAPDSLAFDGNGNLYVADEGDGMIWKVTPSGVASIFASGFINGLAQGTYLLSLAFDGSGNLYVANQGNNTVSIVTPAGVVSTYANGFNEPTSLAFDGSGNLYVANGGVPTVLSVVTPAGVVSMFASGVGGSTGGRRGGPSQPTPLSMVILSAPVAPAVITQPQEQTVAASESATFSVAFSGAPASNTFQWQRLPAGSSTWLQLIDDENYSGSAKPTLTVSGATFAMSGDQFQCVATNVTGSATSSAATLTVAAVTIITEPQNQNFVASYDAIFNVDASGASLAYQWQVSADDGTTWTPLADGADVSGAATPQLTLSNTSAGMSGYEYECVVTNPSGSATSSPATATVVPFLAYLANQSTGDVSAITPAGVLSTYASGFNSPSGLACDANGNLYVADWTDGTISKITPAGVVSIYASGFSYPNGLALDGNGNLYVASAGDGTVSKMTPAGVVSIIVSGLLYPASMVFDGSGNLYVADSRNGTILVVTPAGLVSTYASGFNTPYMVFDGSGNLYVSNSINENGDMILKVAPGGAVSTFASGLSLPASLAVDGNGNLYVVDASGVICKITPAGVVSTFVTVSGIANPSITGLVIISPPALPVAVPAIITQPQNQTTVARASAVFSVAVSGTPGSNTFQWWRLPAGSSTWIQLSDDDNYSGSASPALVVSDATFAMSGDEFQCVATNAAGPVTSNAATLSVVAVTINAQPGNQLIAAGYRAIFDADASGASLGYQWQASTDGGTTWTPLANGTNVSGATTPTLTLSNVSAAISGYEYECVVTNSSSSATTSPATLTVAPFLVFTADPAGGNIYEITPAGIESTFVGGLYSSSALAFDAVGNLYVACDGIVFMVTPDGVVSTFASGFSSSDALAFDRNGNLYVANGGNGTISMVTPAGVVSTFASGFISPDALAFDGSGNLYVADPGNVAISKVTPAGVVSTFISNFDYSNGLIFDGSGNLYVTAVDAVSMFTPGGVGSIFASGFQSIDYFGGGSYIPIMYNLTNLAFGPNGNLYVAIPSAGKMAQVAPSSAPSFFINGVSYPGALAILSAPASPTIIAPPQSRTVTAEQSAVFSAAVSGAPGSNTFQWQRLPAGGSIWINLSDNALYAGSATASLTVLNTTASMTGDQYQCIITNSVGSTPSNPATLTVNPPASPPSTPPATFGAWQNLWFTPSQMNSSAVSAALAAPANDGVANLIKYAFNLDPFSSPGSGGNPQLPQPVVSNGDLVLIFNAPQGDLTYTVQASTDLNNWSTTGVTTQVTGSTMTASYPIAPGNSAFMRIVITSNP